MKRASLYLLLPICSVFSAWLGWNGHEYFNDIDSKIYKADEVTNLDENWGKLILYTDENTTTTYGTKNMLTAVAEIKPGQQIHPPHLHTAEEFLYIVEGNGTWSLNGQESVAQAGDLLYAKPWDLHGLKNTGDQTLRFFVVKWDNKGVPVPVSDKK